MALPIPATFGSLYADNSDDTRPNIRAIIPGSSDRPSIIDGPRNSKVGECSIHPVDGRILTSDAISRDILRLPGKLVERATRSPFQRMLGPDGRPYEPGTTVPTLQEGVEFRTIRAVRWERGDPWAWFEARYLKLRGGKHCVVLVEGLPPHTLAALRQNCWTCSQCDRPTTAVADYHGRDVCLECWSKTDTMRLRLASTQKIPGVDR